jgi:predicted nuclease of predicted toxin-antitoxin system
MKLLIDMNPSPDWVAFLAQQGIESTYWSTVGSPHATDREIMEWAKARDHVVFTHDLDFGILLALTQDAGPSVIQIRTLDTFPEAIGLRLVQAMRTYEAYLREGSLLTIDEERQRVRVLPLRRNR